MPLTLLKQSRNPHEITLGFSIIIAAIVGLTLGPISVTLRDGVSVQQQIAWGALSTLGGFTSLFGSFWRAPISGLKLEQAGQFMMGFGAAAYAALLFNESTFNRSGLVIIMTIGIAVGAFARVVQIWWGLRKLKRAGIL